MSFSGGLMHPGGAAFSPACLCAESRAEFLFPTRLPAHTWPWSPASSGEQRLKRVSPLLAFSAPSPAPQSALGPGLQRGFPNRPSQVVPRGGARRQAMYVRGLDAGRCNKPPSDAWQAGPHRGGERGGGQERIGGEFTQGIQQLKKCVHILHGTHSKHTYTNTLLLTYLQFRFMELPVFSLATLVEAAPLKGVGVPSVSQSGDESSFRRRGSGKLGPGYQSRSSWLYFFGAPGLCPRGGGRSSPIPFNVFTFGTNSP